jgi:hypothetical protein
MSNLNENQLAIRRLRQLPGLTEKYENVQGSLYIQSGYFIQVQCVSLGAEIVQLVW